MKCLYCCLSLSVLALSGCGRPPDAVVAEVGEHPIMASSVRDVVADLLPGERTDKTGDEARRRYLQILIDGRLLVLEARNRGIDTTHAVEKAATKAVNERARALYHARMPAGAQITEAEVRQQFEQEGFDRERELTRIVTPDRATINAVVEKLESGQPFEEVALAHSIDATTAPQGGRLGYVGRLALGKHRIPADLFQSLADGEVSRPIPAVKGTWQIVRFTDTVPAEFASFAGLIETKLRKELQVQAREQRLEMLANTYRVRLDEAGLTEMMEAYRRRDPGVLAASSSPLFHHDKGIITVADADDAVGALGLRRAFSSSALAEEVVRHVVLYPRLIELEAAAAGLFDTADIREFRKRKRDEVMVEETRRLALAGIDVSEEEIRQCYDANPGVFRIEGYARVEELLLPSEAVATEIRDRIVVGEKFGDLVAHSLRRDARKKEAQFHFHRLDRQVYPKLVAAIEATSEGVVTGPVAVKGGYSVFRVLERVPESKQPYAQARPRASTLALRQRQAEAFDELIVELRNKYEAQVVVHAEELSEALPDSVLQG